MPFPEYEEMDEPLLCFILFNGGDEYKVEAEATYEPLADFFGLTHEERTQPRPDGRDEPQWHNRVQWARQRLINHGYLDGSERPVWKLTARGVDRANSVAERYPLLKR